ncbi:MAG TPA: methylated-DNA--[protein]-cysteine S-methyltransferase [candidate division Zixibacteria bacterium]|nr:methylated-DNA--[protein]-cysteine S-methyltransferase [candidate division Zixibacteria bacterium]
MRPAFCSLDTPIGRLWVVVTVDGLRAISRGGLPPSGAEPDDAACASVLRELAFYFHGRLRRFSVELDLTDASAFDAAVWRACREIPYGETASYGELGLMAGYPRAGRAVGGAMARCPVAPVVPCHRVIRADGSLGGYGPEPWVKRWLLDFEAGHSGARTGSTHTR